MAKIIEKCKSVMIGRKPADNDSDEYKCALISFFDVNNPHKIGALPLKVLDFQNVEKVRIRQLSVSYYLEGNDLVINDLHEATLEVDEQKHKIVIRGKQDVVEERK
ncbi:MAG TPA: hypothetical protein VJK52_02005 [Candidatus Nanoarchaeia archaeon]|nr:hypothetical protein [Candidatus Nanoarchaeia archaeon]